MGRPSRLDVRGGRARARRRRRGPARRGRDRALSATSAKGRAGAPGARSWRRRRARGVLGPPWQAEAIRAPPVPQHKTRCLCHRGVDRDPSRSSRSAPPRVDRRLNGRPLDSKPPRGHSSDGRAPALQAGGRRFDPGWLHQEVPAREQISRARSRPWTRRVPPLCSLCAARARGEGSARRLSIRWSQRADGVREAHSDRALPTFRANGVPSRAARPGVLGGASELEARPGAPTRL